MSILYLSSAEYIRNRPFEVWVPAYYQSHLPDEARQPVIQKRVQPNRFQKTCVYQRPVMVMRYMEDPNQLQLANYTIEIMLDMFMKKVEFQLAKEEDVVEILDELDRYLLSLRGDVEIGDERVLTYARLVIAWRAEVYKHYFRYMKTHPAALDKLYPNNSQNNNIFHLMNSVGILPTQMGEMDPLKAKAHPPYPLPSPGTSVEDAKPVHEDLYGAPSGSPQYDDDKDFDFDDFLKR